MGTLGADQQREVVLQIRVADVDYAPALGRNSDKRPEIHVVVPERCLRTSRIPYPFEPDSTALSRLTYEFDRQPGR
jgi:hypothetical protein